MIKANFNTYDNYVTDSVYQWDINQVLTVTGLNLSVVPEVHFSNYAMNDRSIVRQATSENQIISVQIPNSLLQYAYPIKAYIGIYEGGTFKVVETITIPVIAKERPIDYKIEDTDEEIYSFKSMMNALANKANTTEINARIDNIIANNNDSEGNSELVDIRVGSNGKTYLSAGAAVRSQFEDINRVLSDRNFIEHLSDVISYDFQYLNYDEIINGEYWSETTIKTADGYYRYPVIKNLKSGTYYWNYLSLNFTYIENVVTGEIVKLSNFTSGDTVITIDYDFNLYATVSVSHKGIFARGEELSEYLYGSYNIRYKNLAEEYPHVFYCGPTREYTKLKDAIEAASAYMDSILYVDKATYDLIEEYGTSFFANYTTADGVGIVLQNRIHIIFEQGSKVVCNYTGDNENVHTYFSPFNAGPYGFTLENAYVESTNTRYTMHDERAGNAVPYKNTYKRCTFIHDSAATSWGAHQALGGGLGCWGDILIEDCYMSSVDYSDVLTYHNAGYENPDFTEFKSNIVIRGCYLEGTIRINSTGYSKMVTHAYVSGNSLTSEPLSGKTTTDAETNIALHAWNNTIRE